jgi:thiamine pyrophosphokinase
VVVVSGGGPPAADAADGLAGADLVIAADRGLDHALALGLRVDIALGDMDSVSTDGLAAAVAEGTRVERHPAAKDQTDLELALDQALAAGAGRIVVLGEDAGRFDHLMAGALLLAHERYAGVNVEARLGANRVTVIRPTHPASLEGAPGDVVSLLPLHGPARGVTTERLLYPLADEDLPAGTTRGVSNEMVAESAQVSLRGGVLLALQPRRR